MTAAQLEAAGEIVRQVNAAGAIVLWDQETRALRVIRGRHVSMRVKEQLVANLEGVIRFLQLQAREGSR